MWLRSFAIRQIVVSEFCLRRAENTTRFDRTNSDNFSPRRPRVHGVSYQRGEVKIDREGIYVGRESPGAYLEHSCDEWVIGGAESIRQMIADLTQALAEIESSWPKTKA